MTIQIKAIEQHFAGLSVLVRYCHEVKGLSTVLRNTLVNLRRCIQKVQEVRVPLLPPQRRYPTETKLNKKQNKKVCWSQSLNVWPQLFQSWIALSTG